MHDEAHDQLTNPNASGLNQERYDSVYDTMQKTLVKVSVKADKLRHDAPTQLGLVVTAPNAVISLNLPKL